MQTKLRQITISLISTTLVITGVILAGDLTPSASPAGTLYTLSDIYNKLNLNTYSAEAGVHSLSTTTLPSVATMYTLTEIWNKIPTIVASTIATGTPIMGIVGTAKVVTGTGTGTVATTAQVITDYYAYDADGAVIQGEASAGTPATVWSADMAGGTHTWQEGIDYCAGTVDGTTGWHLPYIWELAKYYQENGQGDFQVGDYWSSTEVNVIFAYRLSMNDGAISSPSKSGPGSGVAQVRCAH